MHNTFKLFLEMPMQQGNHLALFHENDLFALFQISSEWNHILRDYDYEAAENLLYGIMELRENTLYQAQEVSAVWAKKGYGPFTYLVAMTIAGKEGLIPSRISTQVTPAAKRVWQQFYEGNLVSHEPLENATHHVESYLNCRYSIRSPINLRPMLRKAQILFRNDVHGEKRTYFHEVVDGVLRSRMNDIYGD